MANVSAVLFDYGLVLSAPPDVRAWDEMKRLLGADEVSFYRGYWEHREAYDRGALTSGAYWTAVAADVGRNNPDVAALEAADVALWTQPNEPMIAWAGSLQARGVRTGILSNIGDAMERGVMQLAWMNAFAHYTFSHRLRIAKPDAAIYAHAAEGLGVPAGEILFVDDRAENIEAARAAGMQAVQYVDHESFVQELQRLGLAGLL